MRWCATSIRRAGWLGWLGLALTLAFLAGVLGLVGREILGLFRLKRLARLRLDSDDAALRNDRDAAVAATQKLIAFYGGRPDTAMARRRVAGASRRDHGRPRPADARRARPDRPARPARQGARLRRRPPRLGGDRGQPARLRRRRLRAVGIGAPHPPHRRALWRPAGHDRPVPAHEGGRQSPCRDRLDRGGRHHPAAARSATALPGGFPPSSAKAW